MLKKIEISNFQSHEDSTIEFIPGTNVIIGKSDAGKSAIFRAINWVISNRPLGDSFCSEWGGETKVSLYTIEGDVIERIKTSSKNEYRINGDSILAFGTEVPEEVNAILHIDHYNIQGQMDSPFLLSSTPGEAAKMLNRAASIDSIDRTISNLKKSYSSIHTSIKHQQSQLEEYESQIKEYDNLDQVEDMMMKVEQDEKEKEKRETAVEKISFIIEGIQEVEKRLSQTSHIPTLLKQWEEVDTNYHSYHSTFTEHQKCKSLLKNIIQIQEDLSSTNNVNAAHTIIKETEKLFINWENRMKAMKLMSTLLSKITKTSTKINQVKREVKQLEKQFSSMAPDICPLCKKKWE